MTEKQIAQLFSDRVDNLLKGQTVGDHNPLLSLAAEMVSSPEIDPSPEFVVGLRRRFQRSLSKPPKYTVYIRRRWLIAGVAVVLALVLALVIVWNPLAPSAAEVLACTADAVAIGPGYIEHIVFKNKEEKVVSGSSVMLDRDISEYWARTAVTTGNRLTTVEVRGTIYGADDAKLVHPLAQIYCSPIKFCYRSLDASVPDLPNANSEGCIVYETPARNDPGPFARYKGEGVHEWIDRMQDNVERIEFQDTSFNDRPVYSLTYHDTFIELNTNQGVESASRTTVTYTATLYIDHETYLPVGYISKVSDASGGSMIATQTILQYEVLEIKNLDFDPFAWPSD